MHIRNLFRSLSMTQRAVINYFCSVPAHALLQILCRGSTWLPADHAIIDALQIHLQDKKQHPYSTVLPVPRTRLPYYIFYIILPVVSTGNGYNCSSRMMAVSFTFSFCWRSARSKYIFTAAEQNFFHLPAASVINASSITSLKPPFVNSSLVE